MAQVTRRPGDDDHAEDRQVQPFRDQWEYLEARLAALDARLETLVEVARARRPSSDRQASTGWGHGMFVSDDEVDAFLGRRQAAGDGSREGGAGLEQRTRATLESGVDLPLERLAGTFRLSPWESEVLILCLAPELDRRYERLYGYLHDDLNRRHASMELALALLGDDISSQAGGRTAFAESAPLLRAGLVIGFEEGSDPAGRTGSDLRLDARIAQIVLGSPELPRRPWLRWLATESGEAGGLAAQLTAMARETFAAAPGHKLLVSLHGGGSATAIDLAAEVCGALDAPLLLLDLPLLIESGAAFERSVREAAREALLQPCALLVVCGDTAGSGEAAGELKMTQLAEAVGDFAWLGFVLAPRPVGAGAGSRQPWLTVELPPPDLAARAACWSSALHAAGYAATDAEADSLAVRYRVPASQLRPVLDAARVRAGLRGPGAVPDMRDVEAAARDAGAAALAGLASRISPRYRRQDIILTPETARQIDEVIAAVESRRRVLSDWGLGARLSRGRGLSALFSGAPGTGKTMAAEIIAGELGLDLYTVDLATVVSKYIGETEKNLSRIFSAAETTSSVLFFDEADALFGKRSEVKDAHDRYANVETAYLLQRIDTYEGLVILATNLKRNIDDAFLRRMHFLVELPFPDVQQRLGIWRSLAPPETPVAGDVDWDFLAEKFALSGGNIKGAFLHAAYQAAARNRPIGMADLVRGLRRELDKMGKVTSAGDFGRYWPMLSEARR